MRRHWVGLILCITFSCFEANAQDDFYTVQEGDSLGTIAIRLYGDARRWRKIAQDNNLESPYPLRIGQKLKVSLEKLPEEEGTTKVVSFWREVLGKRSPVEDEWVANEATSLPTENCDEAPAALANLEPSAPVEENTVPPAPLEDWPMLANYVALGLGYENVDYTQVDFFPRADRYLSLSGELSVAVSDLYRVNAGFDVTPIRFANSTPSFGNQYVDIDMNVSAPQATEAFGLPITLAPNVGLLFTTTFGNDALLGYRNVLGAAGGLEVEAKLNRRHYPHVGTRVGLFFPLSLNRLNYLLESSLGWRIRLNRQLSLDSTFEYSKFAHPGLEFNRQNVSVHFKIHFGF